jgi:hypothetical protein
MAVDGYGRDCTMQCESPLHRGKCFAIEAQLLATSLGGVRYDIATLAEHLLNDDEGREVSPFRPCLIPRHDSPDFRWLQRWIAVEEAWAASEHPWISAIRDPAETHGSLTCKAVSPPLAALPRPRRPIDPNLSNSPCRANGCSDSMPWSYSQRWPTRLILRERGEAVRRRASIF